MYEEILRSCTLCPRECGADRAAGEKGFCGAGAGIRIARSAPHYWEEPCISGENGSGAVFFSECTLRCVFCQNAEISRGGRGIDVTPDELAEEFLYLQSLGVHNINLVTPTHYLPGILAALDTARSRGLNLPVVYNCGGYEKADTIRMLDGYVDIYLPDIKYFSDKYAVKYSAAPGYFRHAAAAVAEMLRQTGECSFDRNGMITGGVIIRHLMLPGLLFDTKKIVDYISESFGDRVYLSLMSQYTVTDGVRDHPQLNRTLPHSSYSAMVDYCAERGLSNVYIQTDGAADEKYIPEFYGDKRDGL